MMHSSIGDTSPHGSPESVGTCEQPSSLQRPLLLTIKEAAALIGIGRTTLYRLMDAGEIHSVHVGTSRRIPVAAAYGFVERLCRSGEASKVGG